MPAAVLLAFLALALPALAGEPAPTYRYTAELEYLEPTGSACRLWLTIRRDGESYTTWRPVIEPTHPQFARFQRDAALLETDRIYYELLFNQEMPRAQNAHVPRLGIITEENLRAVGELQRARDEKVRPPLLITDLIAIRPITQNEYLGIHPRIVQP